jgi:hypothetical protein
MIWRALLTHLLVSENLTAVGDELLHLRDRHASCPSAQSNSGNNRERDVV